MASTLLLAASLPGELPLLASVVADLNDDTAKLVYADWLDEHDDPRGAYLRKFVQAVRDGTELPHPSELVSDQVPVPRAWLDVIGISLVSHIRGLELERHTATILSLAKPAVGIELMKPAGAIEDAERELPLDATKFGGHPRLPKGMDWPRCERGPLEFLTQLNLAEVRHTLAGRALPADGLMSFFMYHNYPEDEYGEGRGDKPIHGGLRIIYSPPDADLWPVPVPEDLTASLGMPIIPYRLVLRDMIDLPGSYGPWTAAPPEEVVENLWELRSWMPRTAHQLFGYSHVSVLCEDPTPGPEWQQLIGFSSDDELKWGWGDGHRLFWYIRSDDLRNLRFDRTTAIDG